MAARPVARSSRTLSPRHPETQNPPPYATGATRGLAGTPGAAGTGAPEPKKEGKAGARRRRPFSCLCRRRSRRGCPLGPQAHLLPRFLRGGGPPGGLRCPAGRSRGRWALRRGASLPSCGSPWSPRACEPHGRRRGGVSVLGCGVGIRGGLGLASPPRFPLPLQGRWPRGGGGKNCHLGGVTVCSWDHFF